MFSERALACTKEGNFSISLCKEIDEELYQYIRRNAKKKYNITNNMLGNILAYNIEISDTIQCSGCGEQVAFSRARFNPQLKKLYVHCNKRCSLLARHKDPNYTKKVITKSKETYTKKKLNDPDIWKRRSKENAIIKRERYGDRFFFISEGHAKRRENIFYARKAKTLRLIEYFGEIRFLRICFNIHPTKIKNIKVFETMLKHFQQFYAFSGSSRELYISIKHNDSCLEMLCGRCGTPLSKYKENGEIKRYKEGKCRRCWHVIHNNILLEKGEHTFQKMSLEDRRAYQLKAARVRKETGSAALAVEKAILTMKNDIDENGLTGLQRRVVAAQKTKLENKVISSSRFYPTIIPQPIAAEKKREYYLACKKETFANRKYISGIEKIGKKTYHIDHIFPISKGFIYGIPPELLGAKENLKLLEASVNRRKSNKIIALPNHIKKYLIESKNYKILEEIDIEIDANKD